MGYGKAAKAKAKRVKRRPVALSPGQEAHQAEARALGLYLSFERRDGARVVVVYDLATGRPVGWYAPESGRCRFGDRAADAASYAEALKLAADARAAG